MLDVLGVFVGRVGVVEAQVAVRARERCARLKLVMIDLAWPMCR
jgi:hypothetical protein